MRAEGKEASVPAQGRGVPREGTALGPNLWALCLLRVGPRGRGRWTASGASQGWVGGRSWALGPWTPG